MNYFPILIFLVSLGIVCAATEEIDPDYVYFSYNGSNEVDFGNITDDLINGNFSYDPIYNISFGGYCDGSTFFCKNSSGYTSELSSSDDNVLPLGAGEWIHFNFTNIQFCNYSLVFEIDGGATPRSGYLKYDNGSLDNSGDVLNSFSISTDGDANYNISINVNSSNPSFDLSFSGSIGGVDYIALSTKNNLIHSRFNTTYKNIFDSANLVYNLSIKNNNTQMDVYNSSKDNITSKINTTILDKGKHLVKFNISNYISNNNISYFDASFNNSVSINSIYVEIINKPNISANFTSPLDPIQYENVTFTCNVTSFDLKNVTIVIESMSFSMNNLSDTKYQKIHVFSTEGLKEIQIIAYDSDGVSSSINFSVDVTKNNMPYLYAPNITELNLELPNPTIVKINASDLDRNISKVNFTIYPSKISYPAKLYGNSTNGTWQTTINFQNPGNYSINVTAWDNLGNYSTYNLSSVYGLIYVKNPKPNIYYKNIDRSTIYVNESILAQINVSDNSFYVSNTTFLTYNSSGSQFLYNVSLSENNTDGRWQTYLNFTQIGNYSIYVVCFDNLGKNSSKFISNISVLNVIPKIINFTYSKESIGMDQSVGKNYTYRIYIDNKVDVITSADLYLTNNSYSMYLGQLYNESSDKFGYWNRTLQIKEDLPYLGKWTLVINVTDSSDSYSFLKTNITIGDSISPSKIEETQITISPDNPTPDSGLVIKVRASDNYKIKRVYINYTLSDGRSFLKNFTYDFESQKYVVTIDNLVEGPLSYIIYVEDMYNNTASSGSFPLKANILGVEKDNSSFISKNQDYILLFLTLIILGAASVKIGYPKVKERTKFIKMKKDLDKKKGILLDNKQKLGISTWDYLIPKNGGIDRPKSVLISGEKSQNKDLILQSVVLEGIKEDERVVFVTNHIPKKIEKYLGRDNFYLLYVSEADEEIPKKDGIYKVASGINDLLYQIESLSVSQKLDRIVLSEEAYNIIYRTSISNIKKAIKDLVRQSGSPSVFYFSSDNKDDQKNLTFRENTDISLDIIKKGKNTYLYTYIQDGEYRDLPIKLDSKILQYEIQNKIKDSKIDSESESFVVTKDKNKAEVGISSIDYITCGGIPKGSLSFISTQNISKSEKILFNYIERGIDNNEYVVYVTDTLEPKYKAIMTSNKIMAIAHTLTFKSSRVVESTPHISSISDLLSDFFKYKRDTNARIAIKQLSQLINLDGIEKISEFLSMLKNNVEGTKISVLMLYNPLMHNEEIVEKLKNIIDNEIEITDREKVRVLKFKDNKFIKKSQPL